MMQINHLRCSAPKEGERSGLENAEKWLKRRLQPIYARREGNMTDWSKVADKPFKRGIFVDIRS
jgi:hypothetical protein